MKALLRALRPSQKQNKPQLSADEVAAYPNETSFQIKRTNAKSAVIKDRVHTDKYNVVEAMLGQGSYGKVHACTDRATGKPYVVKLSQSSSFSSSQEEEEIVVLSMCKHNNIVALVDVFAEPMQFCIVLERMDGGDLHDLSVCFNARFPQAKLAYVANELLEALNFLHTKAHVIHRDIKPENLLWNRNGEVKLADFGLAMALSKDVLTGHGACGTLGYRAPELIATNSEYDTKVDIWSAGVTLMELLQNARQMWDLPRKRLSFSSSATETSYPQFNHMLPATRLFLKSMLTKWPMERATAAQLLLRHDFMQMKCTREQFCDFAVSTVGAVNY